MPIEHWMMFGTFAEQKHFIYPTPDTYTGVIINANMVAHAPDGLAVFLLENTNLTYFVDPMTHAFQHNPSFVLNPDGEAKASITALALAYDPKGRHIFPLVGKKPVTPADFDGSNVLEEFVECCIKFQRRTLVDAMQQADAIKYVNWVELKLAPHALISPYFYLTEANYESWLPFQLRCSGIAREIVRDERLYAGIVISRGLLTNETKRQRVAEALLTTSVNGFVLWVDDFDEQQTGENELRAFVEFCRSLRDNKQRDVINLHGGYFSVLAAGNLGDGALTGVTHAPEFGEFRAVVPVGGGIPIARYYIPQLHARVRYREAVRLFNAMGSLKDAESFHRQVCACPACVETLNGDAANFVLFGKGNTREVRRGTGAVRIDFPTTATKMRCLKHYLYRKKFEYAASAERPKEELLAELGEGAETYGAYLGDGVSYLQSWQSVFGK